MFRSINIPFDYYVLNALSPLRTACDLQVTDDEESLGLALVPAALDFFDVFFWKGESLFVNHLDCITKPKL